MPTPIHAAAVRDTAPTAPVLDIVVPVFNEEGELEASVRRLHAYLADSLPYTARVTIADNASTDGTVLIAHRLAAELEGVHVVHLSEKGRGRALSAVWSASDAAVLAYMDVDLSTDLAALLPLVAPLISGHSDVAIGSRLCHSSRVVRGSKRELISRSYNLLLHGALATRFSDAQCGFKAIRSEVAQVLLPLVQDMGWFFDTELLVLAERSGLRIHEVPVDWVDDVDSRVDLLPTAVADLRGVIRAGRALFTGALPVAAVRRSLGRGPLTTPAVVLPGLPRAMVRQLVRFGMIGVACTVAYAVLYLATAPVFGAQGANLCALLLTTVLNTAANRRFTFGVQGRTHVWRHQLQGLLIFGISLALTSGSLAALHALVVNPGQRLELTVLVAANLVATFTRFLALRSWVFRRPNPLETSR